MGCWKGFLNEWPLCCCFEIRITLLVCVCVSAVCICVCVWGGVLIAGKLKQEGYIRTVPLFPPKVECKFQQKPNNEFWWMLSFSFLSLFIHAPLDFYFWVDNKINYMNFIWFRANDILEQLPYILIRGISWFYPPFPWNNWVKTKKSCYHLQSTTNIFQRPRSVLFYLISLTKLSSDASIVLHWDT